MGKRICFYLVIMIYSTTLLACKSHRPVKRDFEYGVIETTSQDNLSYISFYDKSLKKIDSKKLKYGSMGDGFTLPISLDNRMFIIPKGIYASKELTIIMEYNLTDASVKEHNTGMQSMNSLAVNDKYVYGVNTIDFISNIVKCDRESGQLLNLEIPDIYISYILVHEKQLFGFGQGLGEDDLGSFIYIIDSESLEITKILDISHLGFGYYDGLVRNNSLFFSISYSFFGQEEIPSNKLVEYDMNKEEFLVYELGDNYPFQIIDYKDKLMITHFDPVGVRGNRISIFNLADKTSDMIELDHNLEQVLLDGSHILVLGSGYLYRYNKDFVLEDSVSLLEERKTDYNYYTTGFFLRKD